MNTDKERPFPLLADPTKAADGLKLGPGNIPKWLADEAYKHYVALHGSIQSLDRIEKRGGFGRLELLSLLRREAK